MSSATPADVLARRRHLTLTGDADGLADLYAPDAVMEFAFHGPPGIARAHRGPGGDPRVLPADHGVAAADRGLRGGGALPDPGPGGGDRGDAGEGRPSTTTGRSITAMSIQVLRIRDGHIVLFRDFADPRVFQDVMGDARAGS